MPPIDDFFAFTNDDFGSPQQHKKKKKKKKKVKTAEVSDFDHDNATKEGEAKFTTISLRKNNTEEPSTDTEIKEDDTKDEAALTNLLGLSVSSPQPIIDSSASTNIAAAKENVNHVLSDRETRQLNRSQRANESPTKLESERTPATNNMTAADPDDFLNSISSYVTSIKEKEHEIQDLLQSHQQEEVIIKGMKVSPKAVKFEFHIDIQAAGQISGSYDLQVKGSTKISKIINTLMPLFNKEANPQCPDNEWETLVMYVKNLNIILNPSLRCMSLLGYKSQLKVSLNGADFELYAIITTEEYAQMMFDAERKKKLEENALQLEKNKESDDAFFDVTIIDPQRNEIHNPKLNVISLDDEDSRDSSEKTGRADGNQTDPSSLTLSVIQSMPVMELLMLYKYKTHLPSELNTTLFLNNTSVDPVKKLSELNVIENKVFEVRYSSEELRELRAKGAAEEELYSVEKEDEDEDEDLEEIRRVNSGTESTKADKNGSETDYFSIFVAGKDKKRFKVNVKPSTKICEILNFYLQKSGLPKNTKIKLVFDDEDLDLAATVADTELEDEFMIDAVILDN